MGMFSKLASFFSSKLKTWDRGQSGTQLYATPNDLYIELLAKLIANGGEGNRWVHFENTLNNDQFVEVIFETQDEMGLNIGYAKFDFEAALAEAGLAAKHKIKCVGKGLYDVGGVPITDIARIIEAMFVHGYKLPRDYVVDGWIAAG